MIDDLQKRYQLVGMTKSQVIQLLGKPDGSHEKNSIYYFLGPERGWLKIDGEILTITFDKNGRVIEAKTAVT